MDGVRDKVTAVITGAAVGDALGGATEGWTPQQIEERYNGRVTGIVPPFLEDWRTARPIAPYHKGDGHVTDDTLMTRALIEVYHQVGGHLSAYEVASHLVPRMLTERYWIPELETETVLMQRVFFAEKWLVGRLHYGHVDPREAGVGNIVNCGATMYMAPVGLVNLGDPRAAYAEAIDIAGAHQSSYGREAAGVYAAMVARATTPGATLDDVVETALDLAHDGTRAALEAVVTGVSRIPTPVNDDDERALARTVRELVAPFDTVGEQYRELGPDARRPSRTKSIEELPVALALSLAHRGSYLPTVLAAVNYGRDADSIAVMSGAITAGLGGTASVPAALVQAVSNASRIDLVALGQQHAGTVLRVLERDMSAAAARARQLTNLLESA